MVVSAVIDDKGTPIYCEMWTGNTAVVKTLVPIVNRLRKRFHIKRMCIVADRGMIFQETLAYLENHDPPIPYILGARMKKAKEIREQILTTGGRYREVHKESYQMNAPSPLKVKEVIFDGKRYIVCLKSKRARKDANTRAAIIESLEKQLEKGAKKLIGNKGYRKYVKVEKDTICIDSEKVKSEARFDGKWILQAFNTHLSAEFEVAVRGIAQKFLKVLASQSLRQFVKFNFSFLKIWHGGSAKNFFALFKQL